MCACPSCTRPLAAYPLAPSPSGASQWETVCHALVSALPRLLPARFGLVVWIGVLEVRGWFPIQLQNDPGVQSPNHQSKPTIRGKLRRVPRKGQALIEPAPARHFLQLRRQHFFYHLIGIKKCILVACEKRAAVFSKHRSRDALRAGLVAIRSRQNENGSAGCSPQKIDPHTQLVQAQAKTRATRQHSGAELISPKA